MKHHRKQNYNSNTTDFSKFSDFNRGNNSFNSKPREMHKVTCNDCKKECEVPFKPIEGKPVYCRDCYSKHKPQDSSGKRF